MAPKPKEKVQKIKEKAPVKKADANSFAVIATGGKQYKVKVGDTLKIEKMTGDFKEGDSLTFDKVLLSQNGAETTIGDPFLSNTKVTGTLLKSGRAKKVIVMKYKQKSRYYKKNGHRQPFFEIKIEALG